MITQDMIETKAVDYLTTYLRKPKFVLMDRASYEEFNKLFKAKERIVIVGGEEESEVESSVFTMWTTAATMDILSVDTDKTLFEVVG